MKGPMYYKMLHHVHELEEIRKVYSISSTEFELLVTTMMYEMRRQNNIDDTQQRIKVEEAIKTLDR